MIDYRRQYNAFRYNYKLRKTSLQKEGVLGYLLNTAGYVLIIVLLITSLLVSVSSEFLIAAQTNVNYIRTFSEKQKARLIAKSGITLATYVLEADKKGIMTGMLSGNTERYVDSYQDIWAFNFPELSIENGYLTIRIIDENSKINASILANEFVDRTPYYSVTQRFFINMGFPQDYADAIIDWVDIDDSRSPYGAESSDYYLTLETPYRAKNGEMDSIDEMMLVRGITPEIYYGLGGGTSGQEDNLVEDNKGNRDISLSMFSDIEAGDLPEESKLELKIGKERSRKLSDYFRVYGKRSDYLSELNKININTAPYRVLSALTDHMTDDTVTEIIRRRREKPFSSTDEISDLIGDENIRKNIITVRSYFFRIESTGKVNKTTVTITAIYYRDSKRFYYWSEQ